MKYLHVANLRCVDWWSALGTYNIIKIHLELNALPSLLPTYTRSSNIVGCICRPVILTYSLFKKSHQIAQVDVEI